MSVSKLMHTYSLHTYPSHPNYYLCLHVGVLVFMMCNSLPTCTALTVDCYWTTECEFIPHMRLCVSAWYCVDTVHPKFSSPQLVVDSQCNTHSLPYKLQYMCSASIVEACSYNDYVSLHVLLTLPLHMLCATAGTTVGEFL